MASVRPGDVLAGKYRVERVLGQGGMGYVVAARHLQLDQLVAMKFLRRGSLEDGEATGRFNREAKAVVKLRNEHVARVFDVGALDSGDPYMVMEYLDGTDLSALAKERGAIAPSEAVEYVLQACEALAEAHSLGIVHRDIKLANLFVTRGPTGTPLLKVLDFGISKTNPFGESEHEITHTASMLGSPRFMSPEQMRDARAVDGRTDIWSLGVVLYRLIAGRAPFEAETLGRLLTMVMHEHPDPLSVAAPNLPPGLEAIVMRALEKEPTNRYSNVAELAYALVPYAFDAGHARAAADRIAATLLASQVPLPAPSNPYATIPPIRQSGPPGGVDTGTASPWSTQALRNQARSSNIIVWAAVAAATIVVAGVGVFAKVRHDHAASTSGSATAAASLIASPPETAAASAVPAPLTTAEAADDAKPAAPPEVHAKPATTDEKPKKPPMVAAPAPSPPRKGPTHPTPPKDDGIPSTRD